MSVRNRELVFLLPALILTTLGFALVYTVKSETLSWSSLTYGLLFLGLFVIAHLGRRVLAPEADPYLLPVTALLSTLGLLLRSLIRPNLGRLLQPCLLRGGCRSRRRARRNSRTAGRVARRLRAIGPRDRRRAGCRGPRR